MIFSWKTCQVFVIFLPLFATGAIETNSTGLNDNIFGDVSYEDDYNYEDYNGDYEEDPCYSVSDCDFYDNDECANQCHHKHFPNETIEDVFKTGKIPTCCSSHSYTFRDNCKESPFEEGQKVCGRPNLAPSLMSGDRHCPEHCTSKLSLHFNKNNVDINPKTGEFSMKNPSDALKGATFPNYCAAYQCNNHSKGWEVGFDVCVCPDKQHLKALDSAWSSSNLPRCCPQSHLTLHKGQNLLCPLSQNEKGKTCQFSNYREEEVNITKDGDILMKKYDGLYKNVPVWSKLDRSEFHDVCIGPIWHLRGGENQIENPMKVKMFTCKEPCDGKKPCIRTCDTAPTLSNWNSSILRSFFETDSELESHLSKANPLERGCPDSKVRRHLNFTEDCLEKTNGGSIILNWFNTNFLPYDTDNFCLEMKDNRMMAELCVPKSQQKFKFYPYILLTSCVFLLATLVIYSFIPGLLNHYTRIMRHFVATILIAFLIMVGQQMEYETHPKDAQPELCMFLGFAAQYFFLAAFTHMCSMSCEIWLQISGNSSNDKRYRTEILVGYVLPLIFSIMTGLVEVFGSRCSSITPKFAEESCFFSSLASKVVWFYLPIGVLLSINAIMFSLTVKQICSLDRQRRELGIISGQRSLEMDRFLMFLKLFLGMGFMWFFEIISGLLDDHSDVPESVWYLTDVFNMLQGFYVFIIFVCKRNVKEAILKMTRRRNHGNSTANNGISMISMGRKNVQKGSKSKSPQPSSTFFTQMHSNHSEGHGAQRSDYQPLVQNA